MSTTIDNRVVKMTFDNAQFEKGVKSTIKTIEEFEKKLDLKGATAGFAKVGEAADKLNLSSMSAKADKVKDKFNEMGQRVSDSFSDISSAADKVDLSGISRGATTAMTETQTAIDGLDTDSIVYETAQASEGFNAFSVVAIGALMAVGQEIENFISGGLNKIVSGITGIANKALWQPMVDGFKEYETQMGAIQTIMANTDRDFHDAGDIADVNSQLDKLNLYADKTIYNFTEMTRNIGTFTAAGVSMEDAVPAIQGIANLAAMSGSTSQQASTAMYQLSQALSSGTVKLMDWNSVVNAGMGGKLFRDKLLETAYHIHSANGEMGQYGDTLDAVKDETLSFRDSLEKEWITSEVLTEALQQMTYAKNDMTDAEKRAATARLESLGYTQDEIDHIFELGQAAMESATKVRTWTQLWETVGEALGSGWTTTWRTIIGDFQDATNLFTYISDAISGVVDTISNARNAVVEGWAAFGGRDFLFGTFEEDPNGGLPIVKMNGALQNFVEMLKGWAEPVSAAFEDIFDFFNDDFLIDEEMYDSGFADALKEGGDAVLKYREEYLSQFEEGTDEYAAAIDKLNATEQMVVEGRVDPKSYNADFARVLKEGGDAVIEYREKYLAQFEEGTVEYEEAINELNATEEMFNQGLFDGFDPKTMLWDSVGQGLATVTEGFNNLVASLIPSQEMMAGIYDISRTVFSVLELGGTIIGALVSAITGGITFIRIFLDPIIDLVFTIAGSVGRVISAIIGYITDLVNAIVEFGDKTFGWIIPAVKGFVDGLLGILGISEKITGFTDVIINLMDTVWELLDIPGKIKGAADLVRGAIDWIAKAFGLINDDVGENAKTWDNLGERIVKKFDDIKNSIIDSIPFLRDIIEWFKGLFGMVQDGDSNVLKEFVNERLVKLKNNLGKIVKPLVDLGKAIADFVQKAVKSFGELQIVKDIQQAFSNLADTVKNKFGQLPRIFELVGTAIGGAFQGIGSALRIDEKIGQLTDYFSNLTPQKAIDDIKKFGEDVKNNFNGIIDYFKNSNVQKIGMDFFDQFSSKFTDFDTTLMVASGKLKERFPEFSGQIDAGYRSIKTGLGNISDAIHDILGPAFAESETIPELIINIFKRIGAAISDGVSNIIDTIANIKISDIFNFITNPFRKIIEWLETNCPSLKEYLEPIKQVFDDLSTKLSDSGTTIGDVVYGLFDTIGNIIKEHAPWIVDGVKEISKVIDSLPESFKNAAGFITGALSNLPGFVGGIFGGISSLITGFTIASDTEAIKMPGVFQEMFGGLEEPAEDAGNSFTDFLDKFNPANLPEAMGNLGNTIINKIKEELNKVKEYVQSLPEKIDAVAKDFTSENGTLKQIADRLKEIVSIGIMGAIATFVRNIGITLKNISKAIKAHESNDFSEKIKNIGMTIAALGVVVMILGNMELGQIIQGTLCVAALASLLVGLVIFGNKLAEVDVKAFKAGTKGIKNCATALLEIGILAAILGYIPIERLVQGTITLAVMGGLLLALQWLSNKISEKSMGDWGGTAKGLKQVASALVFLAAGITIMSLGLRLLMTGDLDKLGVSVAGVIAIMAAFGVLAAATKDNDIKATGIAMMELGAAVTIMCVGLSLLAGMSWEPVLAAGGAIAAITLAFMGLAAATKEGDVVATAASMLILSVAVVAMCAGLTLLANIKTDVLAAGALAIVGLTLAFAALATVTKEGDIIATSAALVIFGIAVVAMCAGLTLLANVKIENLIVGALAIAALVVAFGALATITKEADLIATSAGLLIFGAAVVAMSYGLAQLASLDLAALAVATVCLVALLGVLALAVSVLANPEIAVFAIIILPLIALAFIAVGAAARLIAEGLSVAIDALIRLATAGPILASFVQTIAENLINIVLAGVAFIALGASLALMSVGIAAFGIAGAAAAGGIALLTLALNAFLDLAQRAQEFNEAGSNITAGIGQGISSGLDGVIQAIMGIGQGILSAILGFFGIASPSELMAEEVGQFIPEGIGMGITDNSDGMMSSLGDTLGGLLGNFGTWVNEEGLPKLQEFGQGLLDKLQNEILPNLLNWVKTEGIPKLGEMAQGVIDHIFEELGKMPGKLLEWAAGLPGKIWDGIKSAWNTITSIGSDIINGIIEGIQSMPGAIADAVVGMASGGLDAIKNFFGIASPSKVMRDEVGRWIPAGLAEGIKQYASLAVSTGVDMAQNVSDGINNSISIINPEINFDYGTVTPVLDMSGVDSAIDSYNKQWAGLDFNAINNNMQNIDASLDLTPMLQSTLDQTNRLGTLQNQNGELLNAITELRNEIAEYNDIMSRMAIVMDTGTLVGALSSDMDNALGQRQILAERGVY